MATVIDILMISILSSYFKRLIDVTISRMFSGRNEFANIFYSVKYTPQWMWLREELKRVNREKTPWLIVVMHVPIYNSNAAHYMEGESMRAVFESWFVRSKVDFIFAGHVHAYERSVCTFLFFMPYRPINTSSYRYVANQFVYLYLPLPLNGIPIRSFS